MKIIAVAVSLLFHLGIILGMNTIPPEKSSAAPKLVEMRVKKPDPPPLPPIEPEPPKEQPKPPPEVKPKLVKKKTVEKVVPDEPKPEPPKEPPKPPPTFTVDMSSTVVGGGGPAVPAVKDGGNMFANPNEPTKEIGPKVTERPPDQGGQGKGTAPKGAYQITKMPVFITPESDRTPPYPQSAKDRGIEGQVLLKLYVGTTGRVEDARILRKLDPECDRVALKWAKDKFRFEPGMAGDEAVGMWIDFSMVFVIER